MRRNLFSIALFAVFCIGVAASPLSGYAQAAEPSASCAQIADDFVARLPNRPTVGGSDEDVGRTVALLDNYSKQECDASMFVGKVLGDQNRRAWIIKNLRLSEGADDQTIFCYAVADEWQSWNTLLKGRIYHDEAFVTQMLVLREQLWVLAECS